MTNGKQKGKRGELELAKVLREYGYGCRRSVQYNGYDPDGLPDVVGLPGVHIECKRVERLNIDSAYDQAVRDSKDGEVPAVFHRRNRRPWMVTLGLQDFMEMYKEGRDGKEKR